MSNSFHSRGLQGIVVLAVLLIVSARGVHAEVQSVTINHPRPVAAALEQLEKIYGLPITYEDPLRVRDWERNQPDEKGQRFAKGESLSFTYKRIPPDAAPEVRKTLAAKAIAEILTNYNMAHGAGTFTLLKTDAGFHVVPTQYINNSGQLEKLNALLSTPISIAPGERTIGELLDEIFHALRIATGQMVVPGTGAPMRWPQRTALSASNEPARSVLDRLFMELPVTGMKLLRPGVHEEVPASISWQLFCDPDPKFGFALNIHIVAPPGAEGGPPGPVDK